ncbi:hypothetical protein Tco_0257004 [Tanacetum coccineum]
MDKGLWRLASRALLYQRGLVRWSGNVRLRGMLDVKRQRFDLFDIVCRITMPTATRSGMTQDAINELIAKRVEEALKAYDVTRNPGTETEIENEQQDDNIEANVNKGNGNGNGNGNPNVNNRGVVPVARQCTYQDFVKCQPLNLKGTEGVVGLRKWKQCFISVIAHPVGVNAAYAMAWKALMKLMTKMVLEEKDQVKKYIGGLPDNIQGNVIAAEPTRL